MKQQELLNELNAISMELDVLIARLDKVQNQIEPDTEAA